MKKILLLTLLTLTSMNSIADVKVIKQSMSSSGSIVSCPSGYVLTGYNTTNRYKAYCGSITSTSVSGCGIDYPVNVVIFCAKTCGS